MEGLFCGIFRSSVVQMSWIRCLQLCVPTMSIYFLLCYLIYIICKILLRKEEYSHRGGPMAKWRI